MRIECSTEAVETALCFAMCKTGLRPPVTLSIFDGLDDVSNAQWPSFLGVDTPCRTCLATLGSREELLQTSAGLVGSALLLFLLEVVPLLDQGVTHIPEMSIDWVSKRANENLSWTLADRSTSSTDAVMQA